MSYDPYGQQQGGYPQQQPGGWPQQPGQPPQQPGGWSQPTQQQGYPPSQPGGWPQQQPGYPQAQQAGWPPQQGFVPQQMPKKRGSGMIILIVVLVVLVGGGAAGWFLYLSPSHSNSPLFNRHNLPSSVPLPNNVTFDSTETRSSTDSSTQITTAGTQWIWLVNGQSAASVAQFYKDNLGGKGWANPHDFPGSGSSTDRAVIACQGSQILLAGTSDKKDDLSDDQGNVVRTVTAPAGGSVLEIDIVTTSSQEAQAFLCSGVLPPTNG
jgi:hypothetical protein